MKKEIENTYGLLQCARREHLQFFPDLWFRKKRRKPKLKAGHDDYGQGQISQIILPL